MKALSIQQPWAWAIIHGKPVENRTWNTNFRGKFLIHAGKTIDKTNYSFIENLLQMEIPKNLPVGGIVGQSEIVDCVMQYESGWFFGPYGFVLKNSIELPFMPCLGKLGFFEVEYQKVNHEHQI